MHSLPPFGAPAGWVRRSHAALDALPPAVRRRLYEYTDGHYRTINGTLRRRGVPTRVVAAQIAALDAALDALPTPTWLHLRRDTDLTAFGVGDHAGLALIERRWRQELGYLSATRRPGGVPSMLPHRRVSLRVVVPPGIPAAAVDKVSKFSGQNEVLLARGLHYRLDEIRYDESRQRTMAIMHIARRR